MQVAGGDLAGVAGGAGDLILILAGLDVLLANQEGALAAGAGKWRVAHRVGAVGHFQSAGRISGRVEHEEVIDFLGLGVEPQLDVHGLAADQVTGAGHDVERGESAGHGSFEARVVHVQRIVDPHPRLDRPAAVGPPCPADMAVGTNQAGHDRAAGDVDALGIGGNLHGIGSADGRDLSLFDDQHAVGDFVALDGDQLRADKGPGTIVGPGRGGD